MMLRKERQLLVFAYIDQKGLMSLEDIRSELKLKEDPDFSFNDVLSDMVNKDYLEQTHEHLWNITVLGDIHFNDLKLDKIDELNKRTYLLGALGIVLSVIVVLVFVKYYPRMLNWWRDYNSH
jgi:hypothetical protein